MSYSDFVNCLVCSGSMWSYSGYGKLLGLFKVNSALKWQWYTNWSAQGQCCFIVAMVICWVCSRSVVTMANCWVCSRSSLSFSDNGKLLGLFKVNSVQ